MPTIGQSIAKSIWTQMQREERHLGERSPSTQTQTDTRRELTMKMIKQKRQLFCSTHRVCLWCFFSSFLFSFLFLLLLLPSSLSLTLSLRVFRCFGFLRTSHIDQRRCQISSINYVLVGYIFLLATIEYNAPCRRAEATSRFIDMEIVEGESREKISILGLISWEKSSVRWLLIRRNSPSVVLLLRLSIDGKRLKTTTTMRGWWFLLPSD